MAYCILRTKNRNPFDLYAHLIIPIYFITHRRGIIYQNTIDLNQNQDYCSYLKDNFYNKLKSSFILYLKIKIRASLIHSLNQFRYYTKMLIRGKFIVLEGLDRSGKSSVSRFLSHKLSEKGPTVLMNFPDRTTSIGTMISHFLSNKVQLGDEAIHLLFSANRWENTGKMVNYLQKGTNIICDRYWYSGVAYSTAKGLNYQWCCAPDKGLIQPDMIIYLKADPQILSKRANYGQERFQRLDFQKKVKQSFEKIFEQNPAKVHVIDVGNKTLKEVEDQVENIMNKGLI